jgi:2'-5' RNA ligase
MPFAVHLFFDANTEAAIKSVWKKLAETEIAPYLYRSANRPHLTLAIYQQLDLSACEQQLESFAAHRNPLPVTFQHLGIFSTTPTTVFLGSTVTVSLLALHAQVHERLRPLGTEPHPYYLPGQWMPHCTLALELESRLITQVLDLGLQVPLPLNGEIAEIGVIEFRPVKHLFGFRLGAML